MTREMRRKIAIDTLSVIKTGGYYIGNKFIPIKAKPASKLFTDDNIIGAVSYHKNAPEIVFSRKTTTNALRELKEKNPTNKVCALNFASAKNPGGGFQNGAIAQEESIARVSNLYPSLVAHSDFYEHNKNLDTALYSDWIIYSGNVAIFKDDDGVYLDEPCEVDIITSSAPNANTVKKNEPHNIPKIKDTLYRRIKKIIFIAATEQVDYIVLGAFGCGVFGNSIKDVAECFRRILIDEGSQYHFKGVEFAIYDRNPDVVKEFENAFFKK